MIVNIISLEFFMYREEMSKIAVACARASIAAKRHQSHGYVLFIVLLFLFVLTLLAVSGGQNIILDNKMQNT